MNLGIIVEGQDDVETYPVIIRRVGRDVDHIYPRQCFGVRSLKTKFVPFLKEFDARRDRAIAKVLVIRDSDCHSSMQVEEQLQGILERSGLRTSFPVMFYATKCKLESWLLADENAINTISLQRGGPGGVAAVPLPLETYKEADTLLSGLLSRAGLSATSKVFAEIARVTDLQRVRTRCPYFARFETIIEDC